MNAAAPLLAVLLALMLAGPARALDSFDGSTLPLLVFRTASASDSLRAVGDAVVASVDVLSAANGQDQLANQLADSPTATHAVLLSHAPENKGEAGEVTLPWPKPNLALAGRSGTGSGAGEASFPLLDMPDGSAWSLQASYADRSLLHHVLGYYVAEAAGVLAPRWRFVEVFVVYNDSALNTTSGPGDYMGLYVLREEPTRGESRVPVEALEPSSAVTTGGWILRAGRQFDSSPTVPVQNNSLDLVVEYPPAPSDDQLEGLTDHLKQVEYTLYLLSEFNDTKDLWRCAPGYQSSFDVNSFVGTTVANEVAFGPNEYARHAYMYKTRSGKLVAGPAIDYEFGFGVVDIASAERACCTGHEGFRWGEGLGLTWFKRMNEDAVFRCRFRQLYEQLRLEGQPLHFDQWSEFVNNQSALIADAAAREAAQWDWATVAQPAPTVVAGNAQATFKDYLVGWMNRRLEWLDLQVADDDSFCPDPAAEYQSTDAICGPLEEEYGTSPAPGVAPSVADLLLAAAAAAGLATALL